MEIHFRTAEPTDIETLTQFHLELNEYEGTETDAERVRVALVGFIGRTDLGGAWLICVDERPVGYIVLTWGYSLEFGGRDAFVDELYIQASHRGQGVGQQTMQFAETYCRAHNIRALHLEVERENPQAQALYQKAGFENRSHYLLMSKRLGG
jgi:ribosomal protein S18 acetylase RimI-like enzyme